MNRRNPKQTPGAVNESQTEPGLRNEMNSNTQCPDVDYCFNPADMIPRDEFMQDDPLGNDLNMKHLCCFAFKAGLVFVIFTSMIGLLLDPTLILKMYNHILKLSESCTVQSKFDDQSAEIKDLHSKLNHLKEELVNLRLSLEKVKKMSPTEVTPNALDVEKKIQEALSKYDADKNGLIDYALESAGASIVSTPLTIPYPSKLSYDFMGVFKLHSTSNPRLLIQPGNLPGQCFAFHGQNGRIRIKLAQLIRITSVTIEHAHPSLISDMTSSPKDFKVYGLISGDGPIAIDLGIFTYLINGPTLQTFRVNSIAYYNFVELHILNNYGNIDYTCVYRFRVHSNIVSESTISVLK